MLSNVYQYFVNAINEWREILSVPESWGFVLLAVVIFGAPIAGLYFGYLTDRRHSLGVWNAGWWEYFKRQLRSDW